MVRRMAKRFEGQVAWITGGGSGIGKALALELAREGAHVAVSGRREARLQEVAREVSAIGGRGLAVPCDVRDEAAVREAADQVASVLGRMDVCVANAGFGVVGKIEELTAEDWRRQLDVNVVGLTQTVRFALPHLRQTGGRIGLLGSVAAMLPLPKNGAYVASKYAVRGIGQTLSIELHGSGVSCTTIHPGFVESEIAQVDNEGRHDPSRKDPRPAKLMWSAEKAAKAMVGALHRRDREHVFTGHGKLAGFVGRHMPGVAHLLMTRNG